MNTYTEACAHSYARKQPLSHTPPLYAYLPRSQLHLLRLPAGRGEGSDPAPRVSRVLFGPRPKVQENGARTRVRTSTHPRTCTQHATHARAHNTRTRISHTRTQDKHIFSHTTTQGALDTQVRHVQVRREPYLCRPVGTCVCDYVWSAHAQKRKPRARARTHTHTHTYTYRPP